MVDTAIFLGAGDSKAEGAPLQGDLFREYFSSHVFKDSHDEMDRELATFFHEIFQIDVDHRETRGQEGVKKFLLKFSMSACGLRGRPVQSGSV